MTEKDVKKWNRGEQLLDRLTIHKQGRPLDFSQGGGGAGRGRGGGGGGGGTNWEQI